MRLYRYLSSKFGLDALQTSTLKLGRPSTLNDPLDCRPIFINAPDRDGQVLDISKLLDARIGLLCFSANCNAIDIWRRYGEQHKGLALGFDLPEGTYYEVGYRPERPVLDWKDMREIFNPENPKAESSWGPIEKAYSTKTEEWACEAEYRFFHPLSAHKIEGDFDFVRFPVEHLKEVIIGAHNDTVSPQDIDRILSQKKYPQSVEIKKCRLDDSTDALHIDSCSRSSLE